MDGTRECHTKWSKSDGEGKISYDIPYVWNLKRNDTNELTYETEVDSQTEKKNFGCWCRERGEGGGEGIVREFGIKM